MTVIPAEAGWRIVQVDEHEDEAVGLRFRCVPVIAWEVGRGDDRAPDNETFSFPVPAPVHGGCYDEDRIYAHRHVDGVCAETWTATPVCDGRDAAIALAGRYLRATYGKDWRRRPAEQLPEWARQR